MPDERSVKQINLISAVVTGLGRQTGAREPDQPDARKTRRTAAISARLPGLYV
jgi:hypothetical protein